MSGSKAKVSETAQALYEWFHRVVELVDKGLFGIAQAGPHGDAVIMDVLSRNARGVRTAPLDANGGLYTPLLLLLAATCKRLDLDLTRGHWQAALVNALTLRESLVGYRDQADSLGLDLGTAALVFKDFLDEALVNSGLAGVDSGLDEEDQRIALGLALNWGMRFLIAYAVECGDNLPERISGRKDLSWIRDMVSSLAH